MTVRPARGADGAAADRAARLLRACDERGLAEVRTGAGLEPAGLVWQHAWAAAAWSAPAAGAG